MKQLINNILTTTAIAIAVAATSVPSWGQMLGTRKYGTVLEQLQQSSLYQPIDSAVLAATDYVQLYRNSTCFWKDGLKGSFESRDSIAENKLIQKMLKADWPNATSLTNILNHKKDVSRKLLLLLYIVTEGVLNDDYDELDEEYLTDEQRLDEHWWRINLILNECGMNELDPRNAYDWLFLYSLNTNDTIGMNEKMEQVIQFLFPSH